MAAISKPAAIDGVTGWEHNALLTAEPEPVSGTGGLKLMRKLTLAVIAVAGMVSAATLAVSADAQGQSDLNIRAEAAYKAADRQMTVVWRRALAAMKALDAQDTSRGGGFGFEATTLDAQRKWLVFRDRQCSIEEAVFKGGSMAPMVGAQCATRMTKERTADLQALLADNR